MGGLYTGLALLAVGIVLTFAAYFLIPGQTITITIPVAGWVITAILYIAFAIVIMWKVPTP